MKKGRPAHKKYPNIPLCFCSRAYIIRDGRDSVNAAIFFFLHDISTGELPRDYVSSHRSGLKTLESKHIAIYLFPCDEIGLDSPIRIMCLAESQPMFGKLMPGECGTTGWLTFKPYSAFFF